MVPLESASLFPTIFQLQSNIMKESHKIKFTAHISIMQTIFRRGGASYFSDANDEIAADDWCPVSYKSQDRHSKCLGECYWFDLDTGTHVHEFS